MSLEQKINYQLNKIPGVKKVIKRVYQRTMYAISPKIKSEGNIVRISPDDPTHEYFFGYYDKSPWDITDRYMLCMRANDTWSDVSPKEKADILLIDTALPETDKNRVKKIAETSSWNVQQSCMLQWLGPDFSSRILFNDYRDGKYVSVIKEIESGKERIISAPIYTVSADGRTALTLDFSRLYNLRPGYGYYNVPEKTKGEALPDATSVWKIDLESGNVQSLLTYKDFANFQPRPEMQEVGSVHKVNHLMLSPSGSRCMVLYRWFVGQRKYTRLVTFNTSDGGDMYVLSDDDMVSHCFWKDDDHILAFENKKDGGPGYYFMKDKTDEYIHCWPQLSNDGHPSYSPDSSLVVTDTYPDRARVAEIKLMDGMNEKKNDVKVIARVFAPFKYDNDTRCDLHPRWNHAGDKICFDSVFEGHRGLYVLSSQNNEVKEVGKKKVLYVFTSCKRSGPVQIMLNLITYLNRNVFDPILITLYDEIEDESDLQKYTDIGVKHIRVPIGKKDIMFGRTDKLKKVIEELNPSIIHSMGVFPDYAISRMGFNCQVITLHNYMREDYFAKFGKVKGSLLVALQSMAINKASKVWTCSESLAKMYEEKDHRHFDFIRNGVDVNRYTRIRDKEEKENIRKTLGIPLDKMVFIYTGQFIDRKDQSFLLRLFAKESFLKDKVLLLLGSGVNYESLYNTYHKYNNCLFTGNVSNVEDYLKASDYYISCSHSEGLPASVLEAMSCGLPVILSDITQHKEIVELDKNVGKIFMLGNSDDCLTTIRNVIEIEYNEMSKAAYSLAHEELSAETMSKTYQREYIAVIESNRGK